MSRSKKLIEEPKPKRKKAINRKEIVDLIMAATPFLYGLKYKDNQSWSHAATRFVQEINQNE
jgi:hypothetical protein